MLLEVTLILESLVQPNSMNLKDIKMGKKKTGKLKINFHFQRKLLRNKSKGVGNT